ncbi:hypothetical protein UXP66_22145 [Enterobacter hormaechei]
MSVYRFERDDEERSYLEEFYHQEKEEEEFDFMCAEIENKKRIRQELDKE